MGLSYLTPVNCVFRCLSVCLVCRTWCFRGWEPRVLQGGFPLQVEILIRVDGREVAQIQQDVTTQDVLLLEADVERVKIRGAAGRHRTWPVTGCSCRMNCGNL